MPSLNPHHCPPEIQILSRKEEPIQNCISIETFESLSVGRHRHPVGPGLLHPRVVLIGKEVVDLTGGRGRHPLETNQVASAFVGQIGCVKRQNKYFDNANVLQM